MATVRTELGANELIPSMNIHLRTIGAVLLLTTSGCACAGTGNHDAGELDAHTDRGACETSDARLRATCAAAVLRACEGGGSAALEVVESILASKFPFVDDAIEDCLIQAGADCTVARRCVGRERVARAEAFNGYCDGDTAVEWGAGYELRTDCTLTAPGNQCVMTAGESLDAGPIGEGARPICSTPSCIVAGGRSCVAGGVEDCGGGRFQRSIEVCEPEWECASQGGAVSCLPTGPSCPTDGPIRCDGNVVENCVGGRTARFDCASLGATCVAAGRPTCDLAPLRCDGSLSRSYCEGDELVYCNLSRIARVNCLDLGFTGCADGTCVPVAPDLF